MKKILIVLSLAGLLVGCNKEADTSAPASTNAPSTNKLISLDRFAQLHGRAVEAMRLAVS